jgi:hypothetical protein
MKDACFPMVMSFLLSAFLTSTALCQPLKCLIGDHGFLMGFNRDRCSTCFDCSSLFKRGPIVISQETDASSLNSVEAELVSDTQQIYSKLGIEGSIDFQLEFLNISGGCKVEKNTGMSIDRMTLIVMARQEFAVESFSNCEFDAEKLNRFSDDELLAVCGEEIIMRQQRTAELYILVSVDISKKTLSSKISGEGSVEIPLLGGCSGKIENINEELASGQRVHVKCITRGLGNLNVSNETLECVIQSRPQTVESLKKLASEHFNRCKLPNGVPTIFFPESTLRLKAVVMGGSCKQLMTQIHPQVSSICYLARDLETTAKASLRFSADSGTHEKRKIYFHKQFERYEKAVTELRSLGRHLLENPTLPQQLLPAAYLDIVSNPIRLDWCPHLKLYDLLAASHYFKDVYEDNHQMLWNLKLKCVRPILSIDPALEGTPETNPRRIIHVYFDCKRNFDPNEGCHD